MTNTDETFRQDMEEKASDEFLGIEGETPFTGEGVAVADVERDGGWINGDDAVVGDTNTVGVVAEVAEQLGGAMERAFGIDDP